MRKRSFGNTVSEYGIILGLIALLAIPALMYLGSIQQKGLNQSASDITQDTNLALLAPKTAKGALAASSGVGSANAGGQQNAGNISQNASTGQLSVPSINGGLGSQTTSVEGATLLVQNLDSLANNGVDPATGRPLPPQVKQSLLQMAQDAKQLLNLKTQAGQGSVSAASLLASQSAQFSRDYAALSSSLADPQYANLKSTISQDVNGIAAYANTQNPAGQQPVYTAASPSSGNTSGYTPGGTTVTPANTTTSTTSPGTNPSLLGGVVTTVGHTVGTLGNIGGNTVNSGTTVTQKGAGTTPQSTAPNQQNTAGINQTGTATAVKPGTTTNTANTIQNGGNNTNTTTQNGAAGQPGKTGTATTPPSTTQTAGNNVGTAQGGATQKAGTGTTARKGGTTQTAGGGISLGL